MISALDTNTTTLLGMALDAASMRQHAIAQNIANVNTPGYRRASVSFEARMAALGDELPRGKPSLSQLESWRPTLQFDAPSTATVQLDRELTDLSATVLHHQALLKVLNKQFELLGVAINDGKR